jgi:hypothetical protein
MMRTLCGGLSLGTFITAGAAAPSLSRVQAKVSGTVRASESLPQAVAGVRLIDSKIAMLATDLGRGAYPPYLFNHAVRTFLFGSLLGRALGQKFDEEVLYLACLLHDLGLTDQFQGESPFEIQGAETAKKFLEEHRYDREKLALVWDGIAMHASAIGQFKPPEIALVGAGAGADVIGPDASQIKKGEVEEIVAAFPRLKFKDAFVKTCADVVQKHPRAAAASFMRDIRERYVPKFHARNVCDRIADAPFSE